MRVSIVDRTRGAARGRDRAITLRPATSVPPGNPSTCVWSARSSPVRPTGVSRAKPRAKTASRSARFSLGATVPAIEEPMPSGDVRAPAGPSASTFSSTERIGARGGAWVRRASRSPSPRPGNTRWGDQATPDSPIGSATSPRTSRKIRVATTTGIRRLSPLEPRGSPTRAAVAVAVPAAST